MRKKVPMPTERAGAMIERIHTQPELDEVKKRQHGYLINQRLEDWKDIVHPLPLTVPCVELLSLTASTNKLYAATYQEMRQADKGRAWDYCPNCHRTEF